MGKHKKTSKINIKKIKKYLQVAGLASVTLTSISSLVILILLALLYYLHNRPYKTALFCLAIGCLVSVWLQVQDNRERNAKKHCKR